MAWLPLDRLSPAGPCIVVSKGQPYVSNPLHPRIFGRPGDWFLPLVALDGHWRTYPEIPTGTGWIIVERRHPNARGLLYGLCSTPWFRRCPPTDLRWAHLPPWPVSAHDRLRILEALT